MTDSEDFKEKLGSAHKAMSYHLSPLGPDPKFQQSESILLVLSIIWHTYRSMKTSEHEKISRKLFGKPYTEVHVELDQYSNQFIGFCHRRLLHHQLGVERIVAKLGEEARAPAIQHIIDDGMVKNKQTNEIYVCWDDGYKWVFFEKDAELKQRAILLELYPDYFRTY